MLRKSVSAGQKGFTLAEALVVVAIIGMAAAVAIPFFMRISRRQKVISAAHEIQSSLLAARARAVRANQNASLVITAASGAEQDHHLDVVAPDNSPAPTPTPVVKGLIQRNAVDFVTLPTDNKVTFAGNGRLYVPPPPTPAQTGVIIVQGPVGSPLMNQVTVQTSSSGKVQVVTPVVWQ